MLEKIRIILVNTSHPGNIGSAARAMKTMGLTQLILVSPKIFPDPKAVEMSVHAQDILDNARVTTSLQEALAGCHLAIGASARSRALAIEPLEPKACAEKIIQALTPSTPPTTSHVALVFGREHAGLTNEELLCCHYHVNIPSNPEYSSLNLAAAVQVLSYELRLAYLQGCQQAENHLRQATPKATIDDVEQFYTHLEMILSQLHFLKKENPALMPKIRRIFNRIQLEKPEVHILRGILTTIQRLI